MKKYFFIVLSLVLFSNLFSQGYWTRLNSPTYQKLEKLFCIDSLNCWAAGDSGLIIHTSNGGVNWEIQNSEVSNRIQDIFFLNHNLGWAVSTRFDTIAGSYIIKTTNGGKVWEKEFFNVENKFFQTIYFLDSLNGWVGGGPSQSFYGTKDGGLTWNIPRFDSSNYSGLPVLKYAFFSKQYGFACGGRIDLMNVIWKTTDAGNSWTTKNICCEPSRDLYFIDSLNIVGVGGDYEYGTAIARTVDGGENWIYDLPGYFGVATALSFRKDNEAWATLGYERKFIISTDSAKTWSDIKTFDNAAILDIVFTDSSHGFAVGDSGVILKYIFDTPSSLIENYSEIPKSIQLFQNFPNPFNPLTRIQFTINSDQFVSLNIFNSLGEKITVLINENLKSGLHSKLFTVDPALPSGVYFYQLIIGSFTATKKMILLR